MFQLKDFTSIVAGMINQIRGTSAQLTDFNIGSVTRTLIEAPAVEIDELYQQMLNGLNEAIPTAVYLAFGFAKLQATSSSGVVTFTGAALSVIPAGTRVSTASGIIYTTDSSATILAGDTTVNAQVTAQLLGSTGNALVSTITTILSPVAGITSVTNPAAISNGRDEETEDARKTRFTDFIETIARGTIDAIAFGAKTASIVDAFGNITEFVVDAVVDEPFLSNPAEPVGYAKCYIWNGSSGATAGLITQAQKVIDGYTNSSNIKVPGWKAAGVVVDVVAVTPKAVNVTATVTLEPGTTLTTAAQDNVSNYLTKLPIGKPAILSEIIAIIQTVPEVYNVSITVPAADVTALINEKISVGTIAIT